VEKKIKEMDSTDIDWWKKKTFRLFCKRTI